MEEQAPVKRGPGRPRKTFEEKQAERLGKIEAKMAVRGGYQAPAGGEKPAAPTTGSGVQAPKRYKMKAKPNWDDIDDVDPSDMSRIDKYHIAKSEWPEGFDLRWVRYETFGKEDTQNLSDANKTGWTPVHQSDFDGRWDGRWHQRGTDVNITYGGLALCARPEEISRKSRNAEYRKAREQIEIKERSLRGGDIPNVTLDAQHKSALQTNRISRTFERISVPED